MISVFKAQPVRDDEPVKDLHLVATDPFPDADREAGRFIHESDAQFIVSAMLASLPGGTIDAALRLLLTHRASLLRVRWPEPKP